MKYLIQLGIITGIFIILNSCNSTKNETELTNIYIDVNSSDEAKRSEIFKLKDIIRLETNKDNLLNTIFRIIPNDDYLIINTSLYDYKGNFINKIGRKGKGPGEYLSIFGAVWLDNNKIRLLDRTQKKVMDYKIDGEYIKEYKIGVWGQAYKYWNGYNFIFTETSVNEFNKSLFVFDSSFTMVGNLLEFDVSDNYKSIFQSSNFLVYEDSLRFFHAFTNYIYDLKVSEGIFTLNPRYYMDFGQNTMPESFLDQSFEDISKFFEAINKTNYAHSLNGYFETPVNVYYFFRCNKFFHLLIYSKDNKKTRVINRIHDDILFNGLNFNVTDEFSSYFYYDNKVFFVVQAYQFKENLDTIKNQLTLEKWDEYCFTNPNIINIYKNIKIDDNPIIVVFELQQQ